MLGTYFHSQRRMMVSIKSRAIRTGTSAAAIAEDERDNLDDGFEQEFKHDGLPRMRTGRLVVTGLRQVGSRKNRKFSASGTTNDTKHTKKMWFSPGQEFPRRVQFEIGGGF
jgi:hypothetical protein